MSLSNPYERLIFIFGFFVFAEKVLKAEIPDDVRIELVEIVEFALLVLFIVQLTIMVIRACIKGAKWLYMWHIHRRSKAISKNARK